MLGAAAGAIASQSRSAHAFANTFGRAVAGVSSFRGMLAGGANPILSDAGGGYRPRYGGAAAGQARHFAASAWAYNRYGPGMGTLMFLANETVRPGASLQDWNLSVAAFDIMFDLQWGRLNLSGVGAYIQNNICTK